MKIKIILLAVCLLAFGSTTFAQKKKPAAATSAAMTPDAVVKNLYAAAKNEKTSPFFQTKNRALVDKYFAKDFADAIWKDAVDANGEMGNIDFDPLYGSQDPKITALVVGKPKEDAGPDDVYVNAAFKNNGKAESSSFHLRREANKTWKIDNIEYSGGDDLASILRYWTDEEYRKGHDAKTFKGDYKVGAMNCLVSPTLSSIELYRVTCAEQEGFKLYAVDGNETETAYIYTDDKGKQQGKFVFKGDEKDGKYFDAAGKEVKVTRVQ